MKKIKSIFSILVCAVLMLISAIPVQAATNDQAVLDARNGVVKVVVYYNREDTPRNSGTGFLINEETIVTAAHVLEGDDNHKVTKFTVVAVGDIEIEANILYKSVERDFAVLKLKQKINGKKILSLGTPTGFDTTSTVYALGFPAISEKSAWDYIEHYNYSATDVTVTSGNVSTLTQENSIDLIQHMAQIDGGNSGGPLIYSNGNTVSVVGINVQTRYITRDGNSTSSYYYAIHIDELIEALDTLGTEYTKAPVYNSTDSGSQASTEPATAVAPETTTAPAPEPEAKPAINQNMIIGIAVAAVVVIAIIIVLIVVSSKKKNAPIPGAGGSAGGFTPPAPPINVPPQHTATGPNGGAGSEGTTVLSQNMGDPNATTVLSASATSACLIRSSNNERINITKPYFKIGKDANRVDYCISGNPAVSRFHASIVSKNGQYFIVDNGTTNHTYVNESMIPANVETQISNGAKIRLADEKFEFKI